MKLVYQNQTGLFPEDDTGQVIEVDRSSNPVRLTVPAREALEAAGARLTPVGDLDGVVLDGKVPCDLVVTRLSGSSVLAIRRVHEPAFPDEIGHAYWEQIDYSQCPECGAPLIWYEAGYVPGYRVCAAPPHHHVLAQPGV